MEKNIFENIFERLYGFYGPRHWWPAKTRLEVIIGAILTQNTAWTNVEKAIANLKKENVLSIKELIKIRPVRLSALIRPSGYYNVKAGRIKNFIIFLQDKYNGSLDRMFKEKTGILRNKLLSVKGVGEETADSILLYAGGKPVFVVDAYTKRVFSRHGLVNESDTYAQVQMKFMSNLKEDVYLFNEYHALIVEMAKNICRKKPECNSCPLKNIQKTEDRRQKTEDRKERLI